MDNEKFMNRYRIPSARAKWHAYDGGEYFVTICTANREHCFGTINRGEMNLSAIGQYVASNLENVTAHYPYVEIPLFVIMPNHLHAVVIIDGDKIPKSRRDCTDAARPCTDAARPCRDAARHVSAEMTAGNTRDAAHHVSTGKNNQMQEIANQCGWLSVAIGGIKSAVTKFAHENHIDFAWQYRFHDHIVRDTNEMNRISDYIENNVARWDSDCYYNNDTRHYRQPLL